MATTTVDLPVTTARIVYDDGTPDAFVSTLADEDTSGEIVLVVTGGATHIYPINWDSGPDVTVVLPDPPAGCTLTAAYYVAEAYRETDTGGSTPSFGYNPEPDNAPYLHANTSNNPVIDYLPIGAYDGVVVGRWSEDLSLLATGDEGNFSGDAWTVGNIVGTTDGVIHVAYMALRLVYTSPDLPCDTWVDLDLSTATFTNPTGTAPQGQYVDGVITGLDGTDAQYWFPFELDPLKGDRVEITFAPDSPWDGDGNPLTSDRFILFYDATPGDEDTSSPTQIGDAFSNTADVCTVTIGPGISNWDDPDGGVGAGFTRLLFQTSQSGAVSAIRIRKLCTTGLPLQRLTNRNFGLTSVGYYRQNSSRLTGPL